MKLLMGVFVVMLGMTSFGEREARAQCTEANIARIATYYWTVKPLCQTQQYVYCAKEAPDDPKSPCRINATCMKYVLLCKAPAPQSTPSPITRQSLPDVTVPASFPEEGSPPLSDGTYRDAAGSSPSSR